MKKLNSNKLYVEYRDKITKTNPIVDRKYTLTHSDETGDLFLTIGLNYAYDKISKKMRDEVLATWYKTYNGSYALYVNVFVDDPTKFTYKSSLRRNEIFIRELPLALQAIFYGDRDLLKTNPELYNAPIYIKFNSMYPCINRTEYWLTPKDYMVK